MYVCLRFDLVHHVLYLYLTIAFILGLNILVFHCRQHYRHHLLAGPSWTSSSRIGEKRCSALWRSHFSVILT